MSVMDGSGRRTRNEASATEGVEAARGAAEVRAAYASYDPSIRAGVLALRGLILATAAETNGVGRLHETLKWGQPSFLTTETGSGTTIRLGPAAPASGCDYAMFFICHTKIVEEFKVSFGDVFAYDGHRALLFRVGDPLPVAELRECVRLALTYHR